MSYGSLTGAFRTQEEIRVLRAMSRQWEMLVHYQAKHIQHMQRALTQMNLKLDKVISNIVGVSGQKIVRAIVAGVSVTTECSDHRVPRSGLVQS